MTQKVKSRNVRLCLVLELLWAMHFSIAVSVVYYETFGIDPFQILLMQVVMWLVTVLCDIPIGWLADKWGVRRILLIGIALQTIGSALVPLWCESLWQFSAVITLTGIAWSFTSGTANSIVSTTAADGFSTFQSRRVQVTAIGALVGALGGNQLASISLTLPFIVQPIPFALAFLIAIRIANSQELRSRTSHPMLSSIWFVVRTMLVERPTVRWVILLSATINTSALASLWFVQPDMVQAGVAFALFGVMYAVRTIGTVVFANLRTSLVKRFEDIGVQSMLVVTTTAGALIAGLPTGWAGGVAILVANAVATAFASPLMFDVVKERMSVDEIKEYSTTIFSVATATQAAMMGAFFPLVGSISGISVDTALLFIAIATCCAGSYLLYMYRKTLSLGS